MTLEARKELRDSLQRLYQQSNKDQKNKLLNSFVQATGYERKYAVKLLSQRSVEPLRIRKGIVIYDDAVRASLIEIWHASNHLCSKRLIPFLPEFIVILEKFGHIHLTEDVRTKLLSISPATADRLLKDEKNRSEKRARSASKPANLLRQSIPVKTFSDLANVSAGFLEVDLVSHSGGDPNAQFCYTLVITDLWSGWTEFDAIVNREDHTVLASLHALLAWFPIKIHEIHSDNGGEFINHLLEQYCQSSKISFSRGRPHISNDQAHVEQKNGCIIRQTVGYDRLVGDTPRRILSELYASLRLFTNYFQPSQKLLSKERFGSKIKKRYSRAATPFQNLLDLPQTPKQRLQCQYESLDPIDLLKKIENCKLRLAQFANAHNRPATNEAEKKIRLARRRRRDLRSQAFLPNPPKPGSTKKRAHGAFQALYTDIAEFLAANPSLTSSAVGVLINERYPGTLTPKDRGQLTSLVSIWRDAHPEYWNSYPKNYRNYKTPPENSLTLGKNSEPHVTL